MSVDDDGERPRKDEVSSEGESKFRVVDLLNGACASLSHVEEHIVRKTEERLREGVKRGRTFDDDWAFEYHTEYVDWAGIAGLYRRPAVLWRTRLAPIVERAEAELAGKRAGARIHKGAPFYNVGLSLFRCGAFDAAIQFIGAAGVEEKLLKRGKQSLLLVGRNALSKQVLIEPVIKFKLFDWSKDYESITGQEFGEAEFISLLDWLSKRQLGDAIEAVASPHRVMATFEAPNNDTASHARVQALAGLVLVVESSLRQWQSDSLAGKQLNDRLVNLLSANARAAGSYTRIKSEFDGRWTGAAKKETPAAVNWIIRRALSRLRQFRSVGSRAGVAAFLALRLRNSLMHLIDSDLKIYRDEDLLCRLLGIIFAVIRLSRHGEEATLAKL
jgi:hypothetical protein